MKHFLFLFILTFCCYLNAQKSSQYYIERILVSPDEISHDGSIWTPCIKSKTEYSYVDEVYYGKGTFNFETSDSMLVIDQPDSVLCKITIGRGTSSENSNTVIISQPYEKGKGLYHLSPYVTYWYGDCERSYNRTVRILIDDPVSINSIKESFTDSYSYSTDEKVEISIGSFYNRGTQYQELQVTADSIWKKVEGVSITSNATLFLDYDAIVGGEENVDYYKWFGKRLKFRIVKTFKDGTKTYGNEKGDIAFYPQGLEFDINVTRRTSCDSSIIIEVELDEDTKCDFFKESMDTNLYWVAFSGEFYDPSDAVGGFGCKMQKTEVEGVYQIIPQLDDNETEDPFNTEGELTWTLQLQVTNMLDAYACNKEFTVPERPAPILIAQDSYRYTIPYGSENSYHVPSANNPYLSLMIDDSYELAGVRKPYELYIDNENPIVLDRIPKSYTELNSEERAEQDAIFETLWDSQFSSDGYDGDIANPYRNYFTEKLEEWIEDNIYTVTVKAQDCGTINYNGDSHLGVRKEYLKGATSDYFEAIPESDKFVFNSWSDGTSYPKMGIANIDKDTTIYARFALQEIPISLIYSECKYDFQDVDYDPDDPDKRHSVERLLIEVGSYTQPKLCLGGYSYSGGTGKWHGNEEDESNNIECYDDAGDDGVTHTISCDLHELRGNMYFFEFQDETSPHYLTVRLDNNDIRYRFLPFSRQSCGDWLVGEIITTEPTYNLETIEDNTTAQDIADEYYPNQTPEALQWYEDYKAMYKERWLLAQGLKIYQGVKVNTNQYVKLRDADGCYHTPLDTGMLFRVDAPESPILTPSNIMEPTSPCSNDGSVLFTYEGGGNPSYYCNGSSLKVQDDTITVINLGYGDTTIIFNQGSSLGPAHPVEISIDGGVSIEIETITQTCATPNNGAIAITVENLGSSEKTYTAIKTDHPNQDTTFNISTVSNSATIGGLMAGTYNIIVSNSTCSFKKSNIEVHQDIFSVRHPISTSDIETIGGKDSVKVSFNNVTHSLSWETTNASDVIFNNKRDSNFYGLASAGDYQYIATHDACPVAVDFTVYAPIFDASVTLTERDDTTCDISVGISGTNSLLEPYTIQLLDANEIIIDSSNTEDYALNYSVIAGEKYTLRLKYGKNKYIRLYPALDDGNNTFSTNLGNFSPQITGASVICPDSEISGSINITQNESDMWHEVQYDFIRDGNSIYDLNKSFIATTDIFSYSIKGTSTEIITNTYGTTTINKELIKAFSHTFDRPTPVAGKVVVQNVSCYGGSDGTIALEELSGGSGDYRYSIDDATTWHSSHETITGLEEGVYNIKLQDSSNTCTPVDINNVTIYQPAPLEIERFSVTQPTCELASGAIEVEVEGGNEFYRYEWEKNTDPFYTPELCYDTIVDFVDTLYIPAWDSIAALGDTLAYGNYTLHLSDFRGCAIDTTFTLQQYRNPEIDSVTITDALCYEESTGAVELVNIKDKNSTDYSGLNSNAWEYATIAALDSTHADTLHTLGAFEGLTDGGYELYVYDSIGCQSTTRYPLTINQPDTAIYFKLGTITPVTNKGSATGMIVATVFGGNDGLKDISLLDSTNTVIATQEKTSAFQFQFSKLKAGKYTLQAEDKKGCQIATEQLTVIEPDTALSFIVTQKQDARCKAQVGAFTVQGIGGWGDYGYKRSIDNGFYEANVFTDLYAGHYIVTVGDRLGGTFTDTVYIIEPKDSLQAVLSDILLPTCSDNGSMTMQVTGGTAPYSTWLSTASDTSSFTSTHTFQQSTAGSHLIHLADSNGCRYELEGVLSDDDLLRITDIVTTHATNSTTADGTIEVMAQGGIAPRTYVWSRQGVELANTEASLTGMMSDYYTVEVSEQNGCAVSETVYLPAVTDLLLELITLQGESGLLAKDGRVELLSHADELTQVDVIAPSERMTYQSTDSSASFHMQGNTIYLNKLESGQHFVSGINARNEKVVAEFTIDAYVQYLINQTTIINVGRIGEASGSISLSLEGGAGDNTYVWQYLEEPSTLLEVVDDNNSTQLLNAKAGQYSFAVTDRYGNTIVDTFEIKQPDIALDIIIKDYLNESCKTYEDAFAQVEAIGGWGDYQFRIDTAIYYSNSDVWRNLEVRKFKFFVTDMMGITDSVALTITEPDYLHSSITFIDSVNCNSASDGHVLFDVIGGTQPYYYASAEAPSLWVKDTVARNYAEGDYTFYFTDSLGCVGQDTLTAYMPEPDSLLFSDISVTHTTCDTDNGAMSVALQGGTPSYHYTWTDFDYKIISTDSTVFDLMQNGTYKLNVVDGHNCPQELTQRIDPSSKPRVANIDTTRVICYAEDNGTATVMEVVDGVPHAPYHLTWENGDTGVYSTNYEAGLHYVIITDSNKCTTTNYFEITQPDTVSLTLTDYKDAHCFGYNDGFLEITPAGGVGNYSYLWINGDTLARTDSLYKGDYGITLNDSNLCTITDEFTITEPVKELVDLGEDLKICPSNSIELDGEDFTTHQWVFEEDTISFDRFLTIDQEGDYVVEVTNAIGCFAWDTFNLSIGNDALQAKFLMSSQANLGDTLTLYEMSNLPLDSLYWEYDNPKFMALEDSTMPTYMLHLETQDTGLYNIRLWAYSGGCVSKEIKQIEIIYGNDSVVNDELLGYKKPLIQQLIVYPNPTDGNFTLAVELREAADIEVTTFSVSYGTSVDLRYEYGMLEYQLDYQLVGLNPGVYVIMVRADDERKQIKIVID